MVSPTARGQIRESSEAKTGCAIGAKLSATYVVITAIVPAALEVRVRPIRDRSGAARMEFDTIYSF